ncbi:Na/Pi cotransporter family protein [Chengkuizengella sediminis]|uniref:Na/Pi cotransporter family protein n=1 Tax=Chengkuizengella sediminis TaxID=1885917 RepID=UPI00138977D5|nr:Na/Pi symporter [Chengkuizengella sediminis]NDI33735.1 Na/Pi cotransporter family protein [Chengkuizengella sediminis]
MINDILLPLFAGLCLFLFGMKIMELALHNWAGSHLKNILERFTKTPLRGMVTGTALTAFLQSSSAITVITIGLVNARIMTFPRTLGIILGTNIGTCITTELIGLNISHLALPMLIICFIIWMFSWFFQEQKEPTSFIRFVLILRYISLAIMGFSCVLLGVEIMQVMVPALQSRGMFTWFLEQSQQSLLWGIIAGMCITAIIQSSAAMVAITMSLITLDAFSLELGIAIIVGANIGTCVTSLIASVGGSKSGQFVALSHVILNVGGAILFFPLLSLLANISASISSTPSEQIAHAQTIYNVVSSLIALPFCYLSFIKRMES